MTTVNRIATEHNYDMDTQHQQQHQYQLFNVSKISGISS